MEIKNSREKLIIQFLGIEELSPTEAGVIRGGEGKFFQRKRGEEEEIDNSYSES